MDVLRKLTFRRHKEKCKSGGGDHKSELPCCSFALARGDEDLRLPRLVRPVMLSSSGFTPAPSWGTTPSGSILPGIPQHLRVARYLFGVEFYKPPDMTTSDPSSLTQTTAPELSPPPGRSDYPTGIWTWVISAADHCLIPHIAAYLPMQMGQAAYSACDVPLEVYFSGFIIEI